MEILQIKSDGFSLNRTINLKHKSMKFLHNHDFYELYYLNMGHRKYFIKDAIFSVEEGDVIIIPPNVLHRSLGDDAGYYSRVLLNIPDSCLESSFKSSYLGSMEGYFYKIPQKRRKYFDELLDKLEYEYNKEDNYSSYLIKNYVNELLIFLGRVKMRNDATSFDNETDKLIGVAARYIRSNFDRPISLADVAKSIQVSNTYFSKLFKSKTGFGFSDYLSEVRIAEASKMLIETELSITETAYRCGFNDSSYFATVFKRIKGVTPHKYKKSAEV